MSNPQVKSIIERILRLKEEQDALAEDIREVYAEAKSNGFDKTALGQVVSAIRKRAKDPAQFEEMATIARLYLEAYDGTGTPIALRAHAHEAPPTAVGAEPSRPVASPLPGGAAPEHEDIPQFLRRAH